jgi:hypothetical protein
LLVSEPWVFARSAFVVWVLVLAFNVRAQSNLLANGSFEIAPDLDRCTSGAATIPAA